jgi:hypothetical protein
MPTREEEREHLKRGNLGPLLTGEVPALLSLSVSTINLC